MSDKTMSEDEKIDKLIEDLGSNPSTPTAEDTSVKDAGQPVTMNDGMDGSEPKDQK